MHALDAFDLRRRERTRAGALSGGEQQRVAIAAAAAREAPLVLADEPTAELDERNEQIVLEALARLDAQVEPAQRDGLGGPRPEDPEDVVELERSERELVAPLGLAVEARQLHRKLSIISR